MEQLKLVYDYKDNSILRRSFNQLAKETFGIDFEKWYQNGFWNDNYICYSFADDDKVVANVSINKVRILLEGERKKAIQIGTVMTHPKYQGKGLSSKLIKNILEKYEDEYDFFYLFANDSVLDYYPKFGFKPMSQNIFSYDIRSMDKEMTKKRDDIRKLNVNDEKDFQLMTDIAFKRRPISDTFGVENAEHILTWYFYNIFYDDIYYIENLDTIIIYKKEDDKLHLFDVISKKEVNFNDLLIHFLSEKINEIEFHFTPGFKDVDINSKGIDPDEMIFVRPSLQIKKEFKYPITAQA